MKEGQGIRIFRGARGVALAGLLAIPGVAVTGCDAFTTKRYAPIQVEDEYKAQMTRQAEERIRELGLDGVIILSDVPVFSVSRTAQGDKTEFVTFRWVDNADAPKEHVASINFRNTEFVVSEGSNLSPSVDLEFKIFDSDGIRQVTITDQTSPERAFSQATKAFIKLNREGFQAFVQSMASPIQMSASQ